MTDKLDPDVLALKRAIKAFNGIKTKRMVKATLAYLTDRYLLNVSPEPPEWVAKAKWSDRP